MIFPQLPRFSTPRDLWERSNKARGSSPLPDLLRLGRLGTTTTTDHRLQQDSPSRAVRREKPLGKLVIYPGQRAARPPQMPRIRASSVLASSPRNIWSDVG